MSSAPANPHQGPKLSVRERREKEQTEIFTQLVAKEMQLQRTLWLVLRTSGNPTLIVDQAEMSLLWDLQYSAVEGEPTKLRLTANLIPEATGEQIACLRELLRDTDGALQVLRTHESVNRPDLPLGYLQGKLLEGVDGIVWNAEVKKWTAKPKPLPQQEPPAPNAV